MTPPQVSILVTAFREPQTIRRALDAILAQIGGLATEIIVICPDDETAHSASTYPNVRVFRDPGRGKPEALNLGFGEAHGQIIVMTDGDVYPGDTALGALLAPFDDPAVGAVSGRPVSLSPRDTMLGYWSHLLTDAGAHEERLRRDRRGEFLVCSGYWYAVRAGLIRSVPEDALAEDGVISQIIAEQGYRIRYAPTALVYVRFPETYSDWLMQKVRSVGGYAQPVIARSPLRMRSFRYEASAGLGRALAYPRTFREMLWTLALIFARLHLWLLIFWRVQVRRLPLADLWKRVESTK